MDTSSKEINLKKSDVGFIAKVTQILKPIPTKDLSDSAQIGTIVIVTVQSTIKGKLEHEQQILIIQDGSNCDYKFELNELVEIYGFKCDKRKSDLVKTEKLLTYKTSQCSTYSIKKTANKL